MKQRTLLNVSSSINLVFVLNKLCCFLPDEFTERMRCIAIGITPPPHTTQEPSGQNLLPFQIYFVEKLCFITLWFSLFSIPHVWQIGTDEKDATDNFCVKQQHVSYMAISFALKGEHCSWWKYFITQGSPGVSKWHTSETKIR